MNYLRSSFEYRGMRRYRILIGRLALDVDWFNEDYSLTSVNQKCYSEATQALMEAWSVQHKTDRNDLNYGMME